MWHKLNICGALHCFGVRFKVGAELEKVERKLNLFLSIFEKEKKTPLGLFWKEAEKRSLTENF